MRQPMKPEVVGTEQQARQAALAEYLRIHHPALHAYNERRAAYWRTLETTKAKKSAHQLLNAWDKQNPPPIPWAEQLAIQARFTAQSDPSE
jgi:hypothetical protein